MEETIPLHSDFCHLSSIRGSASSNIFLEHIAPTYRSCISLQHLALASNDFFRMACIAHAWIPICFSSPLCIFVFLCLNVGRGSFESVNTYLDT